MNLIVLRHGQTSFNRENRYLGSLDPALNDVGIAQAHSLTQNLSIQPTAVICSPLLRARQTAEILCTHLGITPEIDPSFRERDVGVYEGLTQQEAQERFPELWAKNVTRLWHEAPPNGESIAEVAHRVHAGINQLSARFAESTVLLVAHGFVAKVIRALSGAGHQDFYDWQLKNGEFLNINVCSQAGLPLSPIDLGAPNNGG